MATEELGFDIIVDPSKGEAGMQKFARSSAEAALKIDQANIRVEKSAKQAAAATEKFGSSSLQAREATVKLAVAQNQLDKAMKGSEQATEQSTEAVKDYGTAIKGVAAGAALGLGVAVSKALDIQAGVSKLRGQLGATVEDGRRYGEIAGKVYAGAYGESLDQVNDAIKNVTQNIGKLGDSGSSSLQSITEDTLSLAQAFDVDLFDVTKAAGTLLRTGLAPDAQYALDLITTGLQKIPGAAEDLLDTFTEYSVQFKALGLTGDQALAFIGSAMQGGARNTDLAADALKEFNLRAKDTTNIDAQAAINELGLSSTRTAKAIAGGGSGAVNAMSQLLTALRAIPDPAERSRLATALLGTQAEDLQSALFAVDPAQFIKGMDGVAGASDRLNATLGDNGQAKIEGYSRRLELLAANAAGTDGPLGIAAAGTVAFGGAALTGAASVAQLGSGLALVPGVSTAATAALVRLKVAALAAGPALAVIGTAIAAIEVAKYVGQAQVAATQTDELTASVLQLGRTGKLGAEGLGLFQRSGVFGLIKDDADDTGDALERFGQQVNNAFGDGITDKANRALNFGKSMSQVEETAGRLDKSFASLAKGGNLDAATRAYDQFIAAGVRGGGNLKELTALFPQYNAAVEQNSTATKAAAAASDVYGGDLEKQAAAAKNAGLTQGELNKAITDYATTLLGLRGDQRAFEEAVDSASESIKTNGKTLDITTAKGRANQAALDAIASAGIKLANETPKGANAQKHFADTLATTRSRLIAAATQMTGSKTRARELANAILGVPSSKRITIRDNIAAAEARLRNLASRIRGIPDGRYTVTEILLSENRRDAATAARGRRAAGGPVTQGVPYIVGERGEELFVPQESGYILPEGKRPDVAYINKRKKDFHRSPVLPTRPSFGNHNNPNLGGFSIVPDGTKASKLIVAVLREAVREQGGDVQKVLGASR